MNHESFTQLVARLEDYARAHPAKYRARVGLLAALGYSYLFLVCIVLLLIIVALLTTTRLNFLLIKIVWLPLALVGVVGRALWVQFPRPEGYEVSRAAAPELFEMVDEVSRQVGSPRLNHVLVTDDFNAAIVQRPRLGIFGWQENYLLVGLPLMHALSPAQFRSVIAHEFGHLSGNHGRFSAWIYRVRLTWIQLLTRLQLEGRYGAFVFERFLDWYAPFFNAYTFVLARAQEYEADRRSIEVAGRDAAAEALIGVEVKSKFLSESYWQNVYRHAEREAAPPATAYTGMLNALQHEAMTHTEAPLWLGRSLMEQTSNEDTHPSLAARLAAMQYPVTDTGDLPQQLPHLFEPLSETAAARYLASLSNDLTDAMNSRWREQATPVWRERHKYVQEVRKQLDSLDAKAALQELTTDEHWTRAQCVAEIDTLESAVPTIREVLVAEPAHANANLALGQYLLTKDDEKGIEHLRSAMERDPSLVLAGCEAAYVFYTRHNRKEEAAEFERRARTHYAEVEAAQRERQDFTRKDKLEPHGLTEAQIEKLRDELASFVGVRKAYLARKSVAHFPDVPLYILGVIPRRAWHRMRSAQAEQELVAALVEGLHLPGSTLVLALERNQKFLRGRFDELGGATIYES
jgi:Zn-dependent protease with chaperone function